MTMTRRDLLSASAAFAVIRRWAPARGAAQLPREADIVVIGAGAAGIAAARRIQAANRSVIVIEAAERIGGRCLTDTATYEVPFDRGARWMNSPESNPMISSAAQAGLEFTRCPRSQNPNRPPQCARRRDRGISRCIGAR